MGWNEDLAKAKAAAKRENPDTESQKSSRHNADVRRQLNHIQRRRDGKPPPGFIRATGRGCKPNVEF